ncbi:MAG: hypothetical protein CVV23_09250 [Ignavibacteriae bacterium HGW-Ignavibacteriae-2]|jgi:hypothetical protein|nr:DUF2442 domain-containing protein [Bacteroidota bacterium]PKL88603.1 MAG: hypothetical protein CVV23_09250 [Ignavibacteriae bacterium HGW-Ignavibacteriae-2]
MAKLLNVKASDKFILFVEYSDGMSGEINLTHLKNKPEYEKWGTPEYFEDVRIDKNTNDICWADERISLCKNAVYKQLELVNLAKRLKLDLTKLDN